MKINKVKMPKGRPVKSEIRRNIIEILFFIKKSYGYDIYKIYKSVYDPVTMRSIYYHLKKGVQLEEIKVSEIKKEEGNYSWGKFVEKIYYTLGKNAKPTADKKVKEYLDKKGDIKNA